MKKAKKLISVLLAVAMVFIIPVTAMAANQPYFAGSFCDDGRYRLELGELNIDELISGLRQQGENDIGDRVHTVMLSYQITFGDSNALGLNIIYEDMCEEEAVIVTSNFFDFFGNISGETISAQSEVNENGEKVIACYFDKNSEYFPLLIASETVRMKMEGKVNGQMSYTWKWKDSNGEIVDLLTMIPNFSTDISEPVETTESAEIVAKTEETMEPISEEVPIIDETTEETSVVEENTEESPVVEETSKDQPTAEETPVADTEASIETDKGGSPDTGAMGVASVSALAVMAFGSTVLSRKKK